MLFNTALEYLDTQKHNGLYSARGGIETRSAGFLIRRLLRGYEWSSRCQDYHRPAHYQSSLYDGPC